MNDFEILICFWIYECIESQLNLTQIRDHGRLSRVFELHNVQLELFAKKWQSLFTIGNNAISKNLISNSILWWEKHIYKV